MSIAAKSDSSINTMLNASEGRAHQVVPTAGESNMTALLYSSRFDRRSVPLVGRVTKADTSLQKIDQIVSALEAELLGKRLHLRAPRT